MWHTIVLVGNCGKDPEMRFTPEGKAVTSFSVAVQDGYGDHKKTIWVRVSCWERTAEAVNQYLQKGGKVLVEGRLVADDKGGPRIWTRQDGTPGASFEVNASTVRFLSSKGENGGREEQLDDGEVPF